MNGSINKTELNEVYLLLGSNEGDRQSWLQQAITQISALGNIVQQSHIYETAAWGIEEQPAFLNLALLLQTLRSPVELLSAIHNIEQNLGRQRTLKWGQRTLDIDILFFNDEIIDTPELKVPHPFIQERRFALAPLNEIAPTLMHPIFKKTITELLEETSDTLEIKKL